MVCFTLRWVAAFLCSLAMTLGFPRSRPETVNSKRRGGVRPALGRPVTMTAAMQPRMPAVACKEGQAVPSRLAQGLTTMDAPLRP